MKKSIGYLLKFTFGISILLLLFLKLGIEDIIKITLTADLKFVFLAYIPFVISLLIGSFNVYVLIFGLVKKISFFHAFKYYLLSWSVGLFMPGKIGDLSIIYFLKKENIPIGLGTAVSITDKIISLITLVLIASFGFFLFFNIKQALIYMALFIGITSLLIFLILNKTSRDIIKKVLGKRSKIFKGFSKSILSYIKTKKELLMLNFIITLLQWFVSAFTIFFLFLAFDTHIPISIVFLISTITTTLSLIPLTISGLGIKESVAVFLYSTLNYSPIITAGVHLIVIMLKYILAICVFVFFTENRLFKK